MIKELKDVIEKIDAEVLGLEQVKIDSLKEMEGGEGNLNYLLEICGKKLLCRVSMKETKSGKIAEEFENLKILSDFKYSPDPIYLYEPDEAFDRYFLIEEYIEGEPFPEDKTEFEKDELKEISEILGKLHSRDSGSLEKGDPSYESHLGIARELITSINDLSESDFSILEKILKKVQESLPEEETHEFTLIHGDICPQNIISSNKGLRLVDWESMQLSDPAKDIAFAKINLGLQDESFDVFLKEYNNYRFLSRDNKRVEAYEKLMLLIYFLWEVKRSLEIREGRLPDEYLKKSFPEEHRQDAEKMLEDLKDIVDMNGIELDLENLGKT